MPEPKWPKPPRVPQPPEEIFKSDKEEPVKTEAASTPPPQQDRQPSERWQTAMNRWHTLGRLATTVEDHFAIGGSPPIHLNRNPGKTEAELMTDQQLSEWLQNLVEFLQRGREKLKQNSCDHWAIGDVEHAKRELRLGIQYLRSIGRLPAEFDTFTIEDLPGDPPEKK